MNKLKYLSFIAAALLLVVLQSCEPFEEDKPGIGTPPAAEDLDFTIVKSSQDPFQYQFENKSSVSGIVSWVLGEAGNKTGATVSARFPMPGVQLIKMTLATRGGTTTITKTLVTEETDWDFLSTPIMKAISGGLEATNGKTWVIDSLSAGHLGVGETSKREPNWWSAQPTEKKGHYLYDDEFTFKLVGLQYVVNTLGSTQCNKDGNADEDGFAGGYYTSTIWEDSYDRDVATNDAARGNLTWNVVTENGASFITLSSQKGVISYDDGNARRYEILDWNENFLYLRTVGGAARYHKLIPKGYVKPTVTFEVDVVAGTGVNTYDVSLKNVVIPAGLAITKVKVDFGNGTVKETTNQSAVLSETYMRAAPYVINVTVTTTNEVLTATKNVTVANNHPDYEEFLLDAMIIYNDFSEVMMEPVNGEDCTINIVDNPSKVYPNKSSKVAFYSKTDKEWANANLKLAPGYRFDLRQRHTFKVLVYGKAGDKILLKLENTDRGGNAWQTGTADKIYTIQKDNTWEVAEFDFAGTSAGWDWTGDIYTTDVTTDSRFSSGFYNIIRIMCNPGVATGTHEFYFDDLAGPHVEGIKSAKF